MDAFEVHYSDVEGFNLEVHVEEENQHLEPGKVIFQVNQAAYGDLGKAQQDLGWSNANAWVLPALAAETENINGDDIMLFLGVAGENESTRVWNLNKFKISLLSAGIANPGDFAMYRFSSGEVFSNPINTKNGVSSSDFVAVSSNVGSHDHWNWAFSSAGLYVLDFQASGMLDGVLYVSEIETYTFNVIPEPSSGALLLIGLVGWMAARKRVGLKE